ncbi:DMT family transporter [Georgenia satyanarayanai]|uniref:DMT family transporter n=1 Tax=Georgenia satyanarayanai TaxID=860221 RepID=UPI001C64E641|nr:DMT family transporter [Georgenia satyanarayanai]
MGELTEGGRRRFESIRRQVLDIAAPGARAVPVTATALLGLLSPLVAALAGAVVLGETLTPVQLSGFAIALAALVAGQLTVGAARGQRRDAQDVSSASYPMSHCTP